MFIFYSCAGLLIGSDAQREFEKGLALFNAGNYERAVPHFVKATELEPEYGHLGRSYLNLRRWLDAIPPLRTANRLSPAETKKEALDVLLDALLAAATDAFKRGNFQGALSHLREGLALSPQSGLFQHELVETLIGFGGQMLSQGRFNEAISAYTEVIDLSPNQFDAYLGLAKAFFKQGDVMKALQAAKKLRQSTHSAQKPNLCFSIYSNSNEVWRPNMAATGGRTMIILVNPVVCESD